MLKRVLFVLPLMIFAACAPDVSDPSIQAAVIHSLTATMWTPVPPTPTSTAIPDTARIVDTLNTAMIGSDPLAETVDAKFTVMDAQIVMDTSTHQATTVRLHVNCDWVFSDSCTPESTFVALMRAFASDEKVLMRVRHQIPMTIKTLEILAFDRMNSTEIVSVLWQDVADFVEGRINGNQLGSRLLRLAGTQ